MSSNPSRGPSQKNRVYCVAVDCKSRKSATPGTKFFRVLRKRDQNQTLKWRRAINRKDPETGELWMPKKFDVICSKHFIDGRFSIRFKFTQIYVKNNVFLCEIKDIYIVIFNFTQFVYFT